MSKRIKCETSEDFKKKVVEEFLQTLQYSTPCQIANYSFPHEDICQLQILTHQGMKIYSLWRDKSTGFVDYCEGEIMKPRGKNIN